MATTHTTDFDPQTDADFARLESDAAHAARRPVLVTAQISSYLSDDNKYMVLVSHRLPDGDYTTSAVATEVTMAEALLALAKAITND